MCWMLQQYAQRVGNLSILNILLGAAHIPSPSAVSAMLSEAEQMCYKCNIPIAASTLRRAKREIELERSVCRGGKRDNCCLHRC